MATAKKLYGANEQLLCMVCKTHDAFADHTPYCGLCDSNSSNLFQVSNLMDGMLTQCSDFAFGLAQRGINDASGDLQQALALIDSAKKKLSSNPLLRLDMLKRGMLTEL